VSNNRSTDNATLASMLYPTSVSTTSRSLMELARPNPATLGIMGLSASRPTSNAIIASMLYPTSVPAAPRSLRDFARPHPATLGLMGLGAQTLLTPQTGFSQLRTLAGAHEDGPMWSHVTSRFKAFSANLCLTVKQLQDGNTKFHGLVSTLNAAYRSHNSTTENGFMIGSWAKDTCIRPPRDVDMYYVLPYSVYQRFQAYAPGANKQSALLQEVKGKILASYPTSSIVAVHFPL
jgi:hypothetical protein